MENRKNEPIKYERELWINAVEALKETVTIRQRRYDTHIKKTLQPGKIVKRLGDLNKARKKIHLIRAPVVSKNVMNEEETEKNKWNNKEEETEKQMELN